MGTLPIGSARLRERQSHCLLPNWFIHLTFVVTEGVVKSDMHRPSSYQHHDFLRELYPWLYLICGVDKSARLQCVVVIARILLADKT